MPRTVTLAEKKAHVVAAKQTRPHHCHWPGCKAEVPPAFWGCFKHWRLLPVGLRTLIWDTYKPGQEITVTPSPAYLKAVDRVQKWIKEKYGGKTVRG